MGASEPDDDAMSLLCSLCQSQEQTCGVYSWTSGGGMPTAALPEVLLQDADTHKTLLTSQAERLIYWPIDDAWYPGEVGDTDEYDMTSVAYNDGDKEQLNMGTEKYRMVPPTEGGQMEK
ncbi:hypothetical protein CYMTET_41576 [Cymbomonas tetramitiformis]|uniref:Uncharacterized protein n=1 Tax=Cymbomonas tetramitiformis TaxID=36881 RepID=A0AAE0F242_9CHLO|nr:hypothetical protein CYMTET_41576 [Cymbomonas tetramitiformis]